jgi:hydroxyacylglutathione hydrolase
MRHSRRHMENLVADTDDIRITRLELGPYSTNCYIVTCKSSGKSTIIDAPDDANEIVKQLQGAAPDCIIMTHNHMDHTGALVDLSTMLKIPVAAHALDAPGLPCTANKLHKDGDILNVGRLKINVIHTPGHTPGSICLLVGRYLLAGDTIFPGGPGHTSTPADFKEILKSIRDKILTLTDDTEIYPGHGGSSILSIERPAIAAFLAGSHHADLCGDVLWP